MNDQEIQHLLNSNLTPTQPSEQDAEGFITEFQRRQRVALMTPTWWQTCKEGVHYLFTEVYIPPMAYATVTALAIFMSLLIIRKSPTSEKTIYLSSYEGHWSAINNLSSSEIHPVSFSEDQKESPKENDSPFSYFFHQSFPGGRHTPDFISM